MGEQYDAFLTTENFTLAYIRIKTASKSVYKDFFYDDFRAFEAFFDINIGELLHQVKEDIYIPSKCERYYAPKKKNLARPMTMLNLLDQIVYQAIANIVADKVTPCMKRYFNINIFGNLFTTSDAENSIFFYEKWKNQWKKFNENKRKAFEAGYEYSAEFDIASFYDTIDHSILVEVLKHHEIDEKLIDLLQCCLNSWTVSSTSNWGFSKTSGIPQGTVSSAFFAELFLFQLDEKMRLRHEIRYFRYADDISIMAKSEQECRKMIVFLDLLARDLSLVPQTEKIEVARILDINEHIRASKIQFSSIAREFKKSDGKLKSKTHRNLKAKFIECIVDDTKFDKSIVRFALYKLNEDVEVKKVIIDNIRKLELYYDGVIFYFDKFYSENDSFGQYILNYLLGDTVLFQYNKALLFRNYNHLAFDEIIFRSNFQENKPFWIVQYYLITWLIRCSQEALAEQVYSGDNYYIKRRINEIKYNRLNGVAKEIFVEELLSSSDPMIAIQGLYLMSNLFFFKPKGAMPQTGFAARVLQGGGEDYIHHVLKTVFGVEIPESFINRLKQDESIYLEAKASLRDFMNGLTIDPSKSLMSLNLFHNIVFDLLSHEKGYTGEFGKNINQIAADFPLAEIAFSSINQARNQKTISHYKDKNGKPRARISKSEYNKLLTDARLNEAYNEIFAFFDQLHNTHTLTR
ncbi:RNA-directed DNA polymerase [Proteiniclasticum sp. QWL-01]|uniref:RNA-directed DNA polymerase n=1 Tax=Proteiniclasticum sp. QWL-01 TaxID=3036945 RepID=UPI00241079D8|nr:RNA-directed DNA polymerase [Proteiniclasticum sp. QWL-01]WFF72262.1 RNA-directed DNA polymerase [Proteiniclasticum sp. QWL-01]